MRTLWIGVGFKGLVASAALAAACASPARAEEPTPTTEEVALGRELFSREWVPNDPRSHKGDGLGPAFNDTSCVACHGLESARRRGPVGKNAVLLTATTIGRSGDDPTAALAAIHPAFREARSIVLHRYSSLPTYDEWRTELLDGPRAAGAFQRPIARIPRGRLGTKPPTEAEIRTDEVIARFRSDISRSNRPRNGRARSVASQPGNGFTLAVSERNPPPLFGAGLIDKVTLHMLLEVEKLQPAEFRGRPHIMPGRKLGRFGWKAQTASLREFVYAACANDLGLEVPSHHQAPLPEKLAGTTDQESTKEKANFKDDTTAAGLDLTAQDCKALVAFVRYLPQPVANTGHAHAAGEGGRRIVLRRSVRSLP